MNLRLFYDGEIGGLNPQQIIDAEDFIAPMPYMSLATLNKTTGVRLSVLSNLPGQKINELYFITDINSEKAKNLKEYPNCEAMYTSPDKGLLVAKGKIKILTDAETKKAKYQTWVDQFFPKGVDDDNYCILKLSVENVRVQLF